MNLPFKDWLIGAGIVLVLIGVPALIAHERSVGALNLQIHASDSTAKAGVAMAAKASTLAATAVQQAQAQHTKALQQLAASEALRKSTEDAARAASEARDAATKAAEDSAASIAVLREAIGRLVSDSRADSARAAAQRDSQSAAIRALLATIAADSTARAAEQAKSRALQTEASALSKELALVKKQQPSFVAQHVGAGVGYGCGQKGCEPVAAVIVRVFP